VTRGSDTRPTTRVLVGSDGEEYVVTLKARTYSIRPKGSRKGGRSEVILTPSAVYRAALIARVEATRKPRRRVRRGLL